MRDFQTHKLETLSASTAKSKAQRQGAQNGGNRGGFRHNLHYGQPRGGIVRIVVLLVAHKHRHFAARKGPFHRGLVGSAVEFEEIVQETGQNQVGLTGMCRVRQDLFSLAVGSWAVL